MNKANIDYKELFNLLAQYNDLYIDGTSRTYFNWSQDNRHFRYVDQYMLMGQPPIRNFDMHDNEDYGDLMELLYEAFESELV